MEPAEAGHPLGQAAWRSLFFPALDDAGTPQVSTDLRQCLWRHVEARGEPLQDRHLSGAAGFATSSNFA